MRSDTANLKTQSGSRAEPLNQCKQDGLSIDKHDDAPVKPTNGAEAPLKSKEHGVRLELPRMTSNTSTKRQRDSKGVLPKGERQGNALKHAG